MLVTLESTERASCGSFGDDVISLTCKKETSLGESVGHSRSRSNKEVLSSQCDARSLFSSV